jgi:Protein of unknown function (DUF2393)
MSTPTGITPPDESRPYVAPEPESTTPWGPIIIGAVAVLVVIGIIFFFSTRGRSSQASSEPDPYAANLRISDETLSTAQNFAGQEVTYIEGKLQNNGSQAVEGATVQVSFKNSLGETVQRELQPLAIIRTRDPYIDTASLKILPLKAGQTREFRLTFEHISTDWDHQRPDLRIMRVSTQ